MKKYLVTNPRYTGEAILIYNDEGVLQKIDLSETDMPATVIGAFKNAVPARAADLATAFTPQTVVVESEIIISFEAWWVKYNYKVHRDRALALWERMTKTQRILAFYELDKYHKYLRKKPGIDKQHPDTYLRTKGWENEY